MFTDNIFIEGARCCRLPNIMGFFFQDFWWWKDSWYHWSQSCEDGRARGWRKGPRHNRLPGSKGKNLSSLYKVNQNDQLYQMPKILFLNWLKYIIKNFWNKVLCTSEYFFLKMYRVILCPHFPSPFPSLGKKKKKRVDFDLKWPYLISPDQKTVHKDTINLISFSFGQFLCFVPLKSCSCGFLCATRAHNTENLERMADRQAKEEVNPLAKEQVYCCYTMVHSAL